MQPKIKASPILQDYHVNNLKEHKKFLTLLLAEERSQEKLRKLYESCDPKNKKRKARLKSKLKPRKRGRQRVCFEYETAKAIVRSEGIMSIAQYKRWYQMNRPKRMPMSPERAYKSQWTGWGDFLGVYNEYTRRPGVTTNGKGKYRTYPEARAFARSLKLKNSEAWHKYTKTGLCPLDIPHRPDVVYGMGKRKEYWLSWKDFLGYGLHNTMEQIGHVQPVLYIAKKPDFAINNVYVVNVIPGGKAALIDHANKLNFKIVAAFYIDGKFDHRAFIASLSSYPYGGIDEFMISNIYDTIETLEEHLSKVR